MIVIYGMLIEQVLGNIMLGFHNTRFLNLIEKQEKLIERLQDLVQHLPQHYLQMASGLFMEQDMRIKLL